LVIYHSSPTRKIRAVATLLTRDELLKNNWGTNCTLIVMKAVHGKLRKIQVAHTEHILRLIQSIPSPKAEPFVLQ